MLRLAANGEPLLNKHFPDMVDYAKKMHVADWIETVTNGSLLTQELGKAIDDAGLDRIRISIEAVDPEGYYEMSGVRVEWDEFLDNLRCFYENKKHCEVYIKIVDAAVDTDSKKKKFYDTFSNCADKIAIEHVIPMWTGYDNIYTDFKIDNQKGLHESVIKKIDICPFPFYSFVINPDGQLTICCSDWKREMIMGDVCKESIVKIWNSDKYREFLINMVKEGRNSCSSTCSKCDYPCFDSVDYLDDYKDKILDRLG